MSQQNRNSLQRFAKLGAIAMLALMAASCSRIPFAPVFHGNGHSIFERNGGRAETGNTPYQVTVRRGDTLSEIALRHGVPTRDIAQANGIRAPFTILVGQRLTVPGAPTHTVRRGESLSVIAGRYNLDTRELARANSILRPDRIYAGQQIVLPWGATGSRRSTSSTQVASISSPRAAARPRAERTTPAPRRVTPTPASSVSARDLAPPARSGRGFMWPVDGQIVSGYGPKGDGQHNDGINIAVPEGTPVRAADSGVVIYAGNEVPGYGNLILIRHESGYVTAYAHNSRFTVGQGHVVDRGEIVALSGRTGRVSSPQVHFEVRRDAQAVNPSQFLAGA